MMPDGAEPCEGYKALVNQTKAAFFAGYEAASHDLEFACFEDDQEAAFSKWLSDQTRQEPE
jgi:hypothetical protein